MVAQGCQNAFAWAAGVANRGPIFALQINKFPHGAEAIYAGCAAGAIFSCVKHELYSRRDPTISLAIANTELLRLMAAHAPIALTSVAQSHGAVRLV